MTKQTDAVVPASVAATDNDAAAAAARLRPMRRTVAEQISRDLGAAAESSPRAEIQDRVNRAVATLNLAPADRDALSKALMDELCGFGPIQPLLDDPSM